MRINPWKPAVVTALLSIVAPLALASDTTFDSRPNATDSTAGPADFDKAQAQVRLLHERLEALEKRVDRLSAAPDVPAPTEAERKRQQRERERQAEFLNQVWTGP